jgi:16S rRNA (cytosine967-C5)-methyltransferase
MKKSSLIGHVCELLELIRPLKQPADNVAKEFFRQRHYLGSKDRRFISDTTFGILRNFTLVRFHAREVLESFKISSLPPIAIYISFALKIQDEDSASVLADGESSWRVSFPRIPCAELIAAIVRSQLPQTILENPVKRIAMEHSFPETIVHEWVERFGAEEAERLCAASNQPAPTVIRVNTLKTTVEDCRRRLSEEGIESEPTLLSPRGLMLKKRINVQASQAFKDGWLEMQDEGSQLISLLLDPKPGETIVDACAGGGGKTLHIAALMKNEGELHAIDVHERRLAKIQPRLRRAGASIAQLDRADMKISDGLFGKADAVLVDAPCSGVGTFRRNPAAKLIFDAPFVDRIVETQKRVLESSASLVKPGGRLVYSTCTLLRQENEEVVETFLGTHPEFHLLSAPKILLAQNIEIESPSDYLVLFPHKTNTDGFFAAVFRRD